MLCVSARRIHCMGCHATQAAAGLRIATLNSRMGTWDAIHKRSTTPAQIMPRAVLLHYIQHPATGNSNVAHLHHACAAMLPL
jgi:hypothetical protein